jgi:hypothetical protein
MNVFIDLGRQMWTMLSTTFRDVMREHHAAYHADKAKVWAGFLSAAAGAMARDLGKDDAVAVLKGIVGVTEATPLQSAQETAAVREFTTKLPKMGMSTVCDLCGETFGNHIAQHPDGRTSACPTVNRKVNS